MKKHLIAAAVAAAVAVPAMAQNVTLSGVIEASYGSIKDDGVSTSGMQTEGVYDGASHWKIEGSEDLGGGLSMGFRVMQEFVLGSRNYVSQATSTTGGVDTSQTNFTDTYAFVKGGFGEVRFGAVTFASRDLSGIYRFNGDFGRISSVFTSAGNDVNNSIQYTSPDINGFSFSVATGKEEVNGSKSIAGKSSGGILRYTAGPVRLGISQTSQSVAKTADLSSGAVAKGKETMFGGSYDFGMIKIGAVIAKDTPKGGAACTTLATCETDGTSVHFDMPVGKGLNAFGSYSTYSSKLVDGDGTAIALGVSQSLSKRTKLFAVYNKNDNDAAGTYVYRNGPSANAGSDNTRAVVGVSHTF
jgi:predicted porin